MAENPVPVSKEDQEYRSKSISHMFKMVLFGGIGGSAFFGLINQVVGKMIEATGPAATIAVNTAKTYMGLTTGGWLVIGGLMAVGAAFTYMSQIESTKLRELQDDRLARKNAECLEKNHAPAPQKAVSVEYEQNVRSDGKQWTQAVNRAPSSLAIN